jgi:hypothetical protein
MRVGGEHPLGIRQNHQEVRLREVRHQGRQGVVVAELDLTHGHRVVLVHDGKHSQSEEREERVPRVEVTAAMPEILLGEQDLGHAPAARLKRLS